jgi:hypothetical protein
MTAAIATGITGAAAAWGVIHWSIPARLRVASKPKRTSCLLRAKWPGVYSAVAQRLLPIPRYDQFSSFSSILAFQPLRLLRYSRVTLDVETQLPRGRCHQPLRLSLSETCWRLRFVPDSYRGAMTCQTGFALASATRPNPANTTQIFAVGRRTASALHGPGPAKKRNRKTKQNNASRPPPFTCGKKPFGARRMK